MIIKKNEYEVAVGMYKARIEENGTVLAYSISLNIWNDQHIKDYIEFLQDILLAKEMLRNENPVN